jgi:hypothetical protein
MLSKYKITDTQVNIFTTNFNNFINKYSTDELKLLFMFPILYPNDDEIYFTNENEKHTIEIELMKYIRNACFTDHFLRKICSVHKKLKLFIKEDKIFAFQHFTFPTLKKITI